MRRTSTLLHYLHFICLFNTVLTSPNALYIVNKKHFKLVCAGFNLVLKTLKYKYGDYHHRVLSAPHCLR